MVREPDPHKRGAGDEPRSGMAMLWCLLGLIAIVFAGYLFVVKPAHDKAQRDDPLVRAAEKLGRSAEKIDNAADKAEDRLSRNRN